MQRLADSRHPAPVVAVGHMPGVQHEQHPRGEFHQPHQTQVQHIAGQLVEVPANGHGEHLEAAGGKDPRQPERDERTMVTEQQRVLAGHRAVDLSGECHEIITKM